MKTSVIFSRSIRLIFVSILILTSTWNLAIAGSGLGLNGDIPFATLPHELQNLSIQNDELMSTAASTPLIQPVVFHVLYKADGTGWVPYSSLTKQIDQLNIAFSGQEARKAKYKKAADAGIRFQLHAIQYIQNDTWHDLCLLPTTITQMRPQIAVDPSRYYNVYVCWAQNNLGMAWLPYAEWFRTGVPAENSWVLGSSIDWRLLPGQPGLPRGVWNQGDILTHETGHHYGLMHPYQDDCIASLPSDGIDDTPRQTGNPFGSCKKLSGRNSCPGLPGKDDIANYMNATNDGCRSHFTPGQINFMKETINQYKPTLKKQLPVDCVSAVDATDQSPDLLPCIGVPRKTAIPGTQVPSSREWCATSKTNPMQWAWACCPAADGSAGGEGGCRLGTPTF